MYKPHLKFRFLKLFNTSNDWGWVDGGISVVGSLAVCLVYRVISRVFNCICAANLGIS